MFSEIGNKKLLRSLGAALGILDPVQAPSRMDVDSVKVTMPIDAGWMAKDIIYATATNIMPAGVGQFYWEMVGLSLSGSAWLSLSNMLEDNVDHDVVILGYHINLSYNAAAATADNTRTFRLAEYRVHDRKNALATGTYGGIWRAWSQILAAGIGSQEATFSFPASGHSMGIDAGWYNVTFPHPIVVPAGNSYGLLVSYDGPFNFSSGGGGGEAITVITSVYGYKVPKGGKVPYLP